MTSAINPNNINGAYPVAGQDNNSQGFRDNFTNTSTNFQYAANEITALQNNTVLTTDLASSSNPVFNNLLTSTLSNGYLQNMYTPLVAQSSTSGSITINYALGSYQTIGSTTGSIQLGFSNFPAAGKVATVVVQIQISSTAHTLQFPAAVTVNTTGIPGLNTSTNVMTFASIGTYAFQFTTSNGGASVSISQTNSTITAFNNTSENLANTAAATGVSASYFSTTGAATATLAAGVAGQIKTFSAVDVTAGNMVITVTNAGWKATGTGTITANVRGAGCTLQYVNSKWFCIGNNGVFFG